MATSPKGRPLEIVEPHADIVRDIYRRYLDIGNVRLLVDQLATERILTPVRRMANVKGYGGCAFSRGQLYAILENPIYTGDIPHRDQRYKGLHKPIIDQRV